jgi:hypothetical protein
VNKLGSNEHSTTPLAEELAEQHDSYADYQNYYIEYCRTL